MSLITSSQEGKTLLPPATLTYVFPESINKVAHQVDMLIPCIIKTQEYYRKTPSSFLAMLGMAKLDDSIERKCLDDRAGIETISDAFLRSIDASAVIESVVYPFKGAQACGDEEKIYSQLRQESIEVFLQYMSDIKESILSRVQNILAGKLKQEEVEEVFKVFSPILDSLVSCLHVMRDALASFTKPASFQALSDQEEKDIVSRAKMDYSKLRSIRYGLSDEQQSFLKEALSIIDKEWTSLENLLIQEIKPFLPHDFQEEVVVRDLLSETSQVVEGRWHRLLGSCYSEGAFWDVFSIGKMGDHTTFQTEIKNIYGEKVSFTFQAPDANYQNLRFFVKSHTLKRDMIPIISENTSEEDLIRFCLPTEAFYNCMSFGVARRALQQLPPAGKDPTPHKLWDVIQQLKDCGAIHLEELGFDLPVDERSSAPSYLTAFVHDAGGGSSGLPDCHVYRCFRDPIKGQPIWMQLLKGEPRPIGFATKANNKQELIRGIPSDPWNWFCQGSWNVFVGYWLIPPEAKFFVRTLRKGKELSFFREQEAAMVNIAGY